jgi:hypothetical protein
VTEAFKIQANVAEKSGKRCRKMLHFRQKSRNLYQTKQELQDHVNEEITCMSKWLISPKQIKSKYYFFNNQ